MKDHSVSTNQDAFIQDTLIGSLVRLFEQQDAPVHTFDTHISRIIVAGEFAYKFKKPVHFDFVDFSTLDARHFYCQEELRLNRRLAPAIYLDVAAITGSALHPCIGGMGEPIEYAVRMRAFSQEALWSSRFERNILSSKEIDELAQKLAQFHQSLPTAPRESLWGAVNTIQKVAADNLTMVAALVRNEAEKSTVDALAEWQDKELQKLKSVLEQRKEQGFIRECHGDLHGGNILTINDHVVVFDCIEFNADLRWIDVMDDLAFIYMDLEFHGMHSLAARLLNDYLAVTGDYLGLDPLRYYRTQRALVRAKVALLRAEQLAEDRSVAALQEKLAEDYLAFALRTIQPMNAGIFIMHGYSGSGKSTVAKYVAEHLGAVQIRSDVERKRMHGMAPTSSAAADIDTGLYNQAVSDATYDRLLTLARAIVASGFSVIVDAAFLKRAQRNAFQKLAAELHVPFFVIDVHAGEGALRERVVARAKFGGDPSDAGSEVLAHQLSHAEAFSDDERQHVLSIDNGTTRNVDPIETACEPIVRIVRGILSGTT